MSSILRQIAVAVCTATVALATLLSPARGDNLLLLVDPYSGVVSIQNPAVSAGTLSLDGYQITSSSGRLVPDPTNTPGVGWDSLTDVGLTGWEEVSPSANALSELNLTSSTSIAIGASLSLGKAFTPNGTQDLQWSYSAAGVGVTKPATIRYAGGLQLQVINLLGAGNVIETTKAVLLNQESSQSFNFDAYTIRSASGSLNPAGFSGFAAHSVAGWESVGPSANALSELNLSSSKTLAAGQDQVLGSPFTTGAVKDLTLQFHLVGASSAPLNGTVLYKDQLAGDANGDHIVDVSDIQLIAAHYLEHGLPGDVNFDGIVDVSDIQTIAAHYLNTLGGGAGGALSAVPEPAGQSLLVAGLAIGSMGYGCRRRNTKHRNGAR